MAKKFDKEVEESIKWVASEYKYLDDLKRDLGRLQYELQESNKKKELDEIKKALADSKKVSRSERRAYRHEEHVEKAMKKIRENTKFTGTLKELEALNKRLEVEISKVLVESSLRVGRIHIELLTIRDLIESDKKGDELKDKVNSVSKEVDNTIRWISALSSDLQKAKRLDKSFFTKSNQYPDGTGVAGRSKIMDLLRGTGYYSKYNQTQRMHLWNRWKQSTDRRVLKDLILKKADLRGFDFSGFRFEGKTEFYGCNFKHANFREVYLKGAKFIDVTAHHTNFYGANLRKTKWGRVFAQNAIFGSSDCNGMKATECDFSHSGFISTDSGADFFRCVFLKTGFQSSDQTSSSFQECDMREADLYRIRAIGITFRGCDMSLANFKMADLKKSKFQNCTFNNVNLEDARFENVEMINCKGLSLRDIKKGIYGKPASFEDITGLPRWRRAA